MKSIKGILKNILFLLVGVGLFYLATKDMNFEALGAEISTVNPWYLVLAFVVGILSHVVRGLRWALLIDAIDYKVSAKNSFYAVAVGYIANLAVPRLGEVSRCAVLTRTNKVPMEKLLGTVITERVVDLITTLALTAIMLFLESERILKLFNEQMDALGKKVDNASTILTVVGVAFAVGVVLLFILWKRLMRIPAIAKLLGFIKGLMLGVRSITKLKSPLMFLLYTVLIWSCYFGMVYICMQALPSTNHLSAIAGLTVLVMGTYGFVAPVQGGLGAYHLIVGATLMAYGLTSDAGAGFAVVAHGFQTLVIIVAGIYSYIALTMMRRKDAADAKIQAAATATTTES